MGVITMVAIALICGLSWFLVFHCQYEDGFFGRIALAAMALGALVVLLASAFTDTVYTFNPETQVILCGMALFLLRHVYRFMRWRLTGDGAWRGTGKG